MKGIAVMHGLSPLTDEYAMISIVHKGNTTSHMYYYFTNPHTCFNSPMPQKQDNCVL